MIFAELQYDQDYGEIHAELAAFLRRHFAQVQCGLQSDSWIWILDGGERVAVDTFTSMKHQVKSPRPGAHVERVIDALRLAYKVNTFTPPEPEGHEDA